MRPSSPYFSVTHSLVLSIKPYPALRKVPKPSRTPKVKSIAPSIVFPMRGTMGLIFPVSSTRRVRTNPNRVFTKKFFILSKKGTGGKESFLLSLSSFLSFFSSFFSRLSLAAALSLLFLSFSSFFSAARESLRILLISINFTFASKNFPFFGTSLSGLIVVVFAFTIAPPGAVPGNSFITY